MQLTFRTKVVYSAIVYRNIPGFIQFFTELPFVRKEKPCTTRLP